MNRLDFLLSRATKSQVFKTSNIHSADSLTLIFLEVIEVKVVLYVYILLVFHSRSYQNWGGISKNSLFNYLLLEFKSFFFLILSMV